ncbi:fimbrial protein [Enterobacter mori]|uniref:fimbrial protein n=1 Tax=Enterobacter mori TaxID=539813 RepID=UPI003D06AD5B
MKYLFFIFLSFFTSVHAHTCWNSSGGGTENEHINVGTIVAQRDAAVGTILASITTGKVITNVINCDEYANYYLTWKMLYNGGVSAGDNVYATNVAGVGIRVKTRNHFYTNPPYEELITNVIGLTSEASIVEFIKTGDIISGTFTAGDVASYYITENGITLGTMTKVIMDGSNNISQVACSISNDNMVFPIGNVDAKDFSGGIGSSPNAKSVQNLELNCDPKANINISLHGSQNPDTSNISVLSLNNQGESGVADGVGVQILYNNEPLEINKLLNLKQAAGGQESFPITARYYQTKGIVKAGSANATATLDLTYQ